MKNIFFICVLSVFVWSCGKDEIQYTPIYKETFLEKSEALVNNDTLGLGVYKGVLVGSTSGSITVYLNNEAGKISANLKLATKTISFSSSQSSKITTSKAIDSLTFTSGMHSFKISVKADGTSPKVFDVNLDGYPKCAIYVLKETSTKQVKCYEGNFTGDSNGMLNFVISGTNVKGLFKDDKDDKDDTIKNVYGLLEESGYIKATVTDKWSFDSSLKDKEIVGSWVYNNTKGEIKAKRKL